MYSFCSVFLKLRISVIFLGFTINLTHFADQILSERERNDSVSIEEKYHRDRPAGKKRDRDRHALPFP